MTNVSDIAKLLGGESLDADPAETREWLEALDALVESAGKDRARYVMGRLT
jgi:pyruvate dehydrogenase E1 component